MTDVTDFEPFDLARAEAGEPVMFRSYKSNVQFLKGIRNRDGEVYDTLFLVKNPSGCETLAIRHADGKSHENILSAEDIVMKPKPPKQRWWFQIWRNVDGSPRNNGVFYNTEEAVLKAQSEGSEIAFVDLPPPTR